MLFLVGRAYVVRHRASLVFGLTHTTSGRKDCVEAGKDATGSWIGWTAALLAVAQIGDGGWSVADLREGRDTAILGGRLGGEAKRHAWHVSKAEIASELPKTPIERVVERDDLLPARDTQEDVVVRERRRVAIIRYPTSDHAHDRGLALRAIFVAEL